MIRKLGININEDEGFVLLTSADLNGDGGLDLQEFHEFMYSSNDALNVDLGKIPVQAKGDKTKNLMSQLKESQERTKL